MKIFGQKFMSVGEFYCFYISISFNLCFTAIKITPFEFRYVEKAMGCTIMAPPLFFFAYVFTFISPAIIMKCISNCSQIGHSPLASSPKK